MDASGILRRLPPLLGLCMLASCSDVRVTAADVAFIVVEPSSASILLGDSVRLTAKVLDGAGNPLRGREIEWSSSDPPVASVDGTGLVRGASTGYATITATSADVRATAEIGVNHPRPELTSVEPSSGQRLETLDLTLTGSGFLEGVTTVELGPGVVITDMEVTGPTTITATVTVTSGAQLGGRGVSVSNPPPGGGTTTLAGGFTVLAENPSPTVGSAEPAAGQRKDTLDVELTGSGFLPGLTTVGFGPDVTVNAVSVNDSTSLTANISIGGGATLGARHVSVANPAPGGGENALAGGFTILEENPPPTVTAALPGAGTAGATLDVTLLGSGFVQGLTTVSFGEGITVNSVTVIFWTSLSAKITIGENATAGPRDVVVTNPPPGGGTFIMHDGFTVLSSGGT